MQISIKDLTATQDVLKQSITESEAAIQKKKDAQTALEADYLKRSETLKSQEEVLLRNQTELEAEKNTLNDSITNFNTKVSRLREVLDTL